MPEKSTSKTTIPDVVGSSDHDDGAEGAAVRHPEGIPLEPDQIYDPADYEDPEFRSAPLVSGVAEAQAFLRDRCGLDLPTTTVLRLLVEELRPGEATEPALSVWASNVYGSRFWPTFTPAGARSERPPRILYVTQQGYDSGCLVDQLNAYGADVVFFGLPAKSTSRYDVDVDARLRGELVSSVAAVQLDVAYMEVGDPNLVLLLAEILLARNIPCVVREWCQIPPSVRGGVTVVPEKLMVDDIPNDLAKCLPGGVLARLDLSRPLVEDWYGENFIEWALSEIHRARAQNVNEDPSDAPNRNSDE